jgi:hypothetical protein
MEGWRDACPGGGGGPPPPPPPPPNPSLPVQHPPLEARSHPGVTASGSPRPPDSGFVTFRVTSSEGPGYPFEYATFRVPVDASCAAAACRTGEHPGLAQRPLRPRHAAGARAPACGCAGAGLVWAAGRAAFGGAVWGPSDKAPLPVPAEQLMRLWSPGRAGPSPPAKTSPAPAPKSPPKPPAPKPSPAPAAPKAPAPAPAAPKAPAPAPAAPKAPAPAPAAPKAPAPVPAGKPVSTQKPTPG